MTFLQAFNYLCITDVIEQVHTMLYIYCIRISKLDVNKFCNNIVYYDNYYFN